MFLTGSAGTGKSLTLKHILQTLRHETYPSEPRAVVVLAPTGAAAIQVEGLTIHAWAGVRERECTRRDAWKGVRVMIIDEISMVPDWLLDALDQGGRRALDAAKPFGGVQMIFCGDFLQLPPVDGRWCFESAAWRATVNDVFELTQPFRQQSDSAFFNALNDIRVGRNVQAAVATLTRADSNETDNDDDDDSHRVKPTRLHCLKRDVEQDNEAELAKLPGEAREFRATDSGDAAVLRHASSWTSSPASLTLKVGAQVVLLRNVCVRRGLVNGARGVVVRFSDCFVPVPVVAFACGVVTAVPAVTTTATRHGKPVATRKQIPLALAWALTVHKAQGMSLDCVHVDLSRSFAPGMAYVALSRCRSLNGLSVSGLSSKSITIDCRARLYHETCKRDEPPPKRRKN